MAETVITRHWLDATLLGDATLTGVVSNRIYHGSAPATAPYPFVVYQLLSPGNDLIVIGGTRVWSDTLWLVKVVARDRSTSTIETAADRVDALLHNRRGVATGGVVLDCIRERPHELPEVTGGVYYVNLGGEYRIKVQAA